MVGVGESVGVCVGVGVPVCDEVEVGLGGRVFAGSGVTVEDEFKSLVCEVD